MKGSGHEKQSNQNNFSFPLLPAALSQEAAQKISIKEHLWSIGVNLGVRF